MVKEGDMDFNGHSTRGVSNYIWKKVSSLRLTGELLKVTLSGDPVFVGIYKFGACLSEKKEKSPYLRSLLSLDPVQWQV